jgi:hypothetical protein
MIKEVFDKLVEGLKEALAVARGLEELKARENDEARAAAERPVTARSPRGWPNDHSRR